MTSCTACNTREQLTATHCSAQAGGGWDEGALLLNGIFRQFAEMAHQDKKQKVASAFDSVRAGPARVVDTSEWPSFPVYTAIRLVCRECLPVHGDESVLRAIDGFLDELSGSFTIPEAYTRSGGSLRLLQYLAAHESKTMDPFLRRWGVNMLTGRAAARGDLQTLKWVSESYLPGEFLTEVVSEAASTGHLQVVEWLWVNHRSVGYWGGIEMCGAIRNKHHEVVEWLRAHVVLRPECAQYLLNEAAASGDLEIVQWLYENFDVEIVDAFNSAACECQWEVVRWFLDNSKEVDLEAALHYDNVYISPAENGDLEMLRFLFERGLVRDLAAVFHAAAVGGHLDVIRWLHEEKGITNAGDAYIVAAERGAFDMLKYLYDKELYSGRESPSLDTAARGGSLETVRWLHLNTDAKCTHQAMDEAAGLGNLVLVMWLHENRSEGCSCLAMHLAAQYGHLDTVKWLHTNRTEGCHALTMKMAAQRSDLEMVRWLHENRAEDFDLVGVMDTAAALGHFDILQWFHDNRNQGCSTAAMDRAAAHGHIDVVKWLHEHGEGCTHRAMDDAAKNGHLEVVKWLHTNRSEGCTTMAIDGASGNSHLKVVKWLYCTRSEGCTSLAIKWLLRKSGHLDTAVFLLSKFPECRTFHLGDEYEVAWLEVLQWLLERVPTALDGCTLNVKSWNGHVCDWLRQNNWEQLEQRGVFSRWYRSVSG